MGEHELHSLTLARDFRVDDVDRMWKWLAKHRGVFRSRAIFESFDISGVAAVPPVFGEFSRLMSIAEKA